MGLTKAEKLVGAWSKYFETLDKLLISKNLSRLTEEEKREVSGELEKALEKAIANPTLAQELGFLLPAITFAKIKRLRDVQI